MLTQLTYSLANNSYSIGTSAGWVSSEGEEILKHAQQFQKQAGGVPLQ